MHSCLKSEYKMMKHDEPPHYLDSLLQTCPDGDGVNLTVMYMNKKDRISFGWGMRFKFCPACGEDLKSGK